MLNRSGFPKTYLVHSGKDALEYLRVYKAGSENVRNENSCIDLAILDVMLPDINGFKICEFIKQKISPTVPVMLMTGFEISEYIAQGIEAGADEFLSKQFFQRAYRESQPFIESLQARGRTKIFPGTQSQIEANWLREFPGK